MEPPSHLVRNEFGASSGGPVYIPKVYNGRNKTFVFFAYEGYRPCGPPLVVSVPSMRCATAISAACRQRGPAVHLVRPLDDGRQVGPPALPRQPDPDDRESPLAKYLYSVTPEPTLPRSTRWWAATGGARFPTTGSTGP